MTPVGQTIASVLWIYLLILIARIVLDYVQMFARDWRPRGVVLVIVELIYTVTDPPLKLLRRFIPPLRVGGVALDLAFLALFIVLQVLIAMASRWL
ncbi:MAG TPA: YggT family protein [Candidatus Nanopelagicales bacterium]|nr:YggT family protein [Candidatus Nanopelagicales bacterium]